MEGKMDSNHDLIVSAQMLTIIYKHERDTVFGKAGLPVAIKNHIKSHGWMDKRKVSKLQDEIAQLRRELEEARSYIERSIGIPATVWQETVDELKAERKRADGWEKLFNDAANSSNTERQRADLNERALALACTQLLRNTFLGSNATPDYFRKLAESRRGIK